MCIQVMWVLLPSHWELTPCSTSLDRLPVTKTKFTTLEQLSVLRRQFLYVIHFWSNMVPWSVLASKRETRVLWLVDKGMEGLGWKGSHIFIALSYVLEIRLSWLIESNIRHCQFWGSISLDRNKTFNKECYLESRDISAVILDMSPTKWNDNC